MNQTYESNYIKNTPDFMYLPPQPIALSPQKNTYDIYTAKFKTAFYGSILFAILSLPTAYKILDIIGKLFSNNIDIVDEYGEAQPLGRVLMALLIGLVLFIL